MNNQMEFNAVVLVTVFLTLMCVQTRAAEYLLEWMCNVMWFDYIETVANTILFTFAVETMYALYLLFKIISDPFYRPFILLQWYINEVVGYILAFGFFGVICIVDKWKS